jgi:hypothetical protein
MGKNYRLAIRVDERNDAARRAEQAGDISKAIKLYEQNIRENYADRVAFDRLMVIYRKQKDYKDELRVINRGVELFKENMKEHLKNSLPRHVDEKKIERLSNAIMKGTGLKNKSPHFPDPIDKWIKRKEIVQKKLEK